MCGIGKRATPIEKLLDVGDKQAISETNTGLASIKSEAKSGSSKENEEGPLLLKPLEVLGTVAGGL